MRNFFILVNKFISETHFEARVLYLCAISILILILEKITKSMNTDERLNMLADAIQKLTQTVARLEVNN